MKSVFGLSVEVLIMRVKVLSLLQVAALILLVFPVVAPLNGINSNMLGMNVANSESGRTQECTTWSGEGAQPLNHISPSIDEFQPSPLKPPAIHSSSGDPLPGQVIWNTTDTLLNISDDELFTVHPGPGRMEREHLNFTIIRSLPLAIPVENDSTSIANGYCTSTYPSPIFMSFNANSDYPVVVDGAWIYVTYDTEGLLNFTIYNATYDSVAGAYSPDSPLYSPFESVNVSSSGTDRWIWLDFNDSRAVIDPDGTEDRVFFIAVWPANSSTILKWYYLNDNQMGDGEDEGDAWHYIGSYLTYEAWDFYMNMTLLSSLTLPYPSMIGMMINGTWPVMDLPDPGTGYWYHDVDITLRAGDTRSYNVTVTWPGELQWPIIFNVTFTGSFKEYVWWDTAYMADTADTAVHWNASLDVEYPSGSQNRLLIIKRLHTGWNVQSVYKDGIVHTSWSSYNNGLLIWNADNGTWLVEALAPNYMTLVEVRSRLSNKQITEANLTETVRVIGYTQTPGGLNITPSGERLLTVYDPHGSQCHSTDSYLYQPGAAFFYWDIKSTTSELGVFPLTVLWRNGTAVGLNETTLTVVPTMTGLDVLSENPPPGGPIPLGKNVELRLRYFYYLYEEEIGLSNATIEIINSSNGQPWPNAFYDYVSGGSYDIYIPTNNATVGVLQNVTVWLTKPLYRKQSYNTSFTVIRRITIMEPIEGYGSTYYNGLWYASPQPYVNDTQNIYFNLTDAYGFHLVGASVIAVLWYNDTYLRYLPWEDLGKNPLMPLPGIYMVTIDTNPIGNLKLHAGDSLHLSVVALKEGYEPAVAPTIHIHLRPRTAYFDISSGYEHIQLFADWNYPVPFRVVLRDNITGADITHANVTAEVPGLFNCTLKLATPGIGLYEITSLDTTGFPNGTYTMILRAEAEDYLSCTRNVTITILPKLAILYTVETQIQPTYLVGSQLQLKVRFFFPDQTPLPQGTYVELEIDISGATPSTETVSLSLNEEGCLTYLTILSEEAIYSFRVTITDAEGYAGLDRELLTLPDGTPFLVYALSQATITMLTLRGIIPWILLVIVLITGTFLGYYRLVYAPRRRARQQRLQAVADTFSDVANLTRLLVLHKESGTCIFDPLAGYKERDMDATLMSGFLQAISTFGLDLAETPETEEEIPQDQQEGSALRELTYEGFRILVHDGEFIRTALVMSGEPSQQLRSKLEQFTAKFEERYHSLLRDWSGRIDPFATATDLVEELFQISLRFPHQVTPERPREVQLTGLESSLYNIAKELSKDRDYVFLGQILSTYLAASKRDKLEVLHAIYQLHQKGLLTPWQVDVTALNQIPEPRGEAGEASGGAS